MMKFLALVQELARAIVAIRASLQLLDHLFHLAFVLVRTDMYCSSSSNQMVATASELRLEGRQAVGDEEHWRTLI